MDSKKYTVSEISRQTGDNVRQVQRKLKDLVSIEGGRYLVDGSIVKMLYPATTRDNNVSGSSRDVSEIDVEYEIVEGFTVGEYAEFQKRLAEYPKMREHIDTLLNQLEYMRRSGESKDRQMELLLRNIRERNFIEAKDKKLDG